MKQPAATPSHLHPWPSPSLARWKGGGRVQWRWPDRTRRPNSRCHRGEAAGRAAGPGVPAARLALLSLSLLPFHKLLTCTAACAAAAGLACWPLPLIVCAGSEDPRCPEGLGSPRPSIRAGSARAPHPPPASPPPTWTELGPEQAPASFWPQFLHLKNEWMEERDLGECSSLFHGILLTEHLLSTTGTGDRGLTANQTDLPSTLLTPTLQS